MTLVEALAELRVDRTSNADDVRRAYLRLLKTKKPESDPEGFRRLREAYELVRSGQQARAPFVQFHAPRAMPTPQPPVAEAVAPFEASPQPSPPAPAAPPLPGPSDVIRLVAQGDSVRAADLLADLYASATSRLDLRTPPPQVALDLVLQLHEAGRVEAANALAARFREWLRASGDELRVLRGPLAARWALCLDLAALPAALSGPVRTLFARAARTGDLASAQRAAGDLRRRNPQAAREDAWLLRERSGAFGTKLAEALSPPVRAVSSRSRSPVSIVIGVCAVMGLRAFLSFGTSTSTDVPAPPHYSSVAAEPGALTSASSAALQLARDAKAAGQQALAERAGRLWNELGGLRCEDAVMDADGLVAVAPSDPGLRTEAEDVANRVRAACPGVRRP